MTGTPPTYTLERPTQVWDDQDGNRWEVGPDREGFEFVEIRQYSADGQIGARVTMPPEVWALLRKHKAVERQKR